MDINLVEMALSAVRVLIVGLVLGAGLPALFAFGMRLQSAGTGERDEGTDQPGPRLPVLIFSGRVVFGFVVLVVLLAVLWITRHSLNHYFGLTIFGVEA